MEKNLSEEDLNLLRKRNRIKKRTPKVHKVVHESGKSTKNLWRLIIERSKKLSSKK